MRVLCCEVEGPYVPALRQVRPVGVVFCTRVVARGFGTRRSPEDTKCPSILTNQ